MVRLRSSDCVHPQTAASGCTYNDKVAASVSLQGYMDIQASTNPFVESLVSVFPI